MSIRSQHCAVTGTHYAVLRALADQAGLDCADSFLEVILEDYIQTHKKCLLLVKLRAKHMKLAQQEWEAAGDASAEEPDSIPL